MQVFPDVDFHTKIRNHRKAVKKTSDKHKKTTTYWRPARREVRILAPPSVTPLL